MLNKTKKSDKATENDDQYDVSHGASSRSPSTQDIMDAITSLKTSFGNKFDVIAQTLSQVQTSLTDITERVTVTEQAIGVHESQIASLETCYSGLASECNRLQDKTCDLEARSRRNNIRIIGTPERPVDRFRCGVATNAAGEGQLFRAYKDRQSAQDPTKAE